MPPTEKISDSPSAIRKVIAPEHEAIHHLFQQEGELHGRVYLDTQRKKRRRRRLRAGAANSNEGKLGAAFISQGFCVLVG